MKFRFKFLTQTQVGKVFGATSHEIGKLLKELGLRDANGRPTESAHEGGFCKAAPSGENGFHYAWHANKTIALLREHGHALVSNPPASLVEPDILSGPFSVRKSSTGEFAIENGDGSTSVWANTQQTASVVARILNTAHKHGIVEQLCAGQKLMQAAVGPESKIDEIVATFDQQSDC